MASRFTTLRTVTEESHGSGSSAGGGSNNRQSKSKSLVEALGALRINNQLETRRQANIQSDRFMTLSEDERRKCKKDSSRPTPFSTASGSAESSHKSGRSAVDSMSTRTKIALDKIEHLERENERLKRVDARRKQELRNLAIKKDRAASLKSRVKEINYRIQQGQQLDVAFLLDITMSMKPSMEMVRNEIVAMASGINDSYPHCKPRFGLATYTDYGDPTNGGPGCDFTSSYKGADSEFVTALRSVQNKDGGDYAEDVFTGLERAADLGWEATNRMLVHIGDSPCHGGQFHDLGAGHDWYYGGDKHGRDIRKILHTLRKKCKISLYCFCHITEHTLKMVQEFKKAIDGDDNWVEEWQVSEISQIPEKVVSASCRTIANTMSVLTREGKAHCSSVKEKVVKEAPSWSRIKFQEGVEYVHEPFSSLRSLLDTIRKCCPTKLSRAGNVQMKIALHPFSEDGALRWPYLALVNQRGASPPCFSLRVVKRFKIRFGKSARAIHAKESYVNQMEVQTVAQFMAEHFNQSTEHLRGVMKVQFTSVSLLEVGDRYFTMEKFLEGEWIRFSNNCDYVNMKDYAATLQAFTHWTYHISRGLLMVTDLQGVKQPDEERPGQHVFCLCDPAIHTSDENLMRFAETNLGSSGFRLFLDSHKCNDVCLHLGLSAGAAGRIYRGTKVL